MQFDPSSHPTRRQQPTALPQPHASSQPRLYPRHASGSAQQHPPAASQQAHPAIGMSTTASASPFTEQDHLHDLLQTEKTLCQGYTIAAMEASNTALVQMATQMFHDVQQAQQQLFQCLHKESQYPIEGVPINQVRQKAQQLSKMKQDFPYA